MSLDAKKLTVRTLSGAVYVALIITVFFLGQWTKNEALGLFVCRVFFLLLGVVGMHEVYHNLALRGIATNRTWGYALGILCYVLLTCCFAVPEVAVLLPAVVMGLLAVVQLFRSDEHPFATWGYTLLPILWVMWPLALLPYLLDAFGALLPLMIFVLIWVNDTFAYLCGSLFGKHKMSPRHSPNKTWEGTLGGALFCIAAAVLLGHYMDGGVLAITLQSLLRWGPLGLLVAFFGTMGDLVESMFKRYVGVKDSGKLLPGHGGMLDRFDSILLCLPFVMFYVALLLVP